MATQAAAEYALDAVVFVPPKSIENECGLFKALVVQGGKKGIPEFIAMGDGIDEDFLNLHNMQEKIPALQQFHRVALENQSTPNAVNVEIDKHSAKDGSLGLTIKALLKGKARVGTSADSGIKLNMSDLKLTKIPPRKNIQDFLEECVLPFAKENNELQKAFRRIPTTLSGDMEYGMAFVTTTLTGTTYAMEGDAFRAGAEFKVSEGGAIIDMNSNVAVDESKKVVSNGKGVVGVRVHFFLLVKTKHVPEVKIKESFPVTVSRDKELQYVLGGMAAKFRRRIFGPRRVDPVEGLMMTDDYDATGDYRQDIRTLEEQADEQTYAAMDVDGDQTHQYVSLRVIDMADAVGSDPPGDTAYDYLRSNNVLYRSSPQKLESIYKAISDSESGSITVAGRVVDAIKPVIKVKYMESLPVVYDRKLSGAHVSGLVPGWVLRGERRERNLIMLWKVSGVEESIESSTIVTAYGNDWHVRESREYVDAGDKEQIEKLESEGFFQLDPAEADPEEVDMAELESGRLVMMGRHLLALRWFKGDEVDGIAQELPTASAPGSSAAASLPAESSEMPQTTDDSFAQELPTASAFGSSVAASLAAESLEMPQTTDDSATPIGIPPIVTNAGTEKTPPRKKFKGDAGSK